MVTMTESLTGPPPPPDIAARAREIADDFAVLSDWEDRFAFLMEAGAELPPLSADERSDANKVRGCASQVWLVSRIADSPHGRILKLRGESDALLVRGLIALVLRLFDGQKPEAVLAFGARDFFERLGLRGALTPQRSNGLAAMLERVRADCAAHGSR